MANPNVFAQFAQPVRSVVDYENDYAKADALKNQNALQSLTLQQQQQSTAQAMGDRNALQQIAANAGGTREGMIAGLRNSGRASLMAQADALEKSGADLSQSQSVTSKNNAETAQKDYDLHEAKIGHAIQIALGSSTPQLARQAVSDAVSHGYMSMQEAQQRIGMIPDDPAQYSQYRLQQLGTLLSAKDQYEANKPVLGTTNTGGATNYTSRDPMTGAVTQNGSVAMTATPGEVLSNNMAGARLAEEKTHNRATEGLESTKAANTAAATPKLNEGQGKATTFAARMADAESTIQAMEAKGVSGSDLRTIAAGNGYTNFLASPDGQDYRQAQENWVTANLRQESGAAIGKDEMAKDVRKFFPAPGDGDSVKAQKARARSVAQQGMLVQAGPGAAQVPGILQKAGGQSAPAADAGVPADIAAILAKHGGK